MAITKDTASLSIFCALLAREGTEDYKSTIDRAIMLAEDFKERVEAHTKSKHCVVSSGGSKSLIDLQQAVNAPYVGKKPVKKKFKPASKDEALLSFSVEVLRVGKNIRNVLQKNGIISLRDLVAHKGKLREVVGLGGVSIRALNDELDRLGLS